MCEIFFFVSCRKFDGVKLGTVSFVVIACAMVGFASEKLVGSEFHFSDGSIVFQLGLCW